MENSRENLLKLLDKDLLKKILRAFTNATGLTANIVDVNGSSIFSKNDAQSNCRFCKLIWEKQKEKRLYRCNASYARAGKQAAIFGEAYIFRCPAGLIEWAVPIIIDKKHMGSIICGQVLMWEPEEFFWIELREMNKVLFDDFDSLFQAAKELNVISAEKVQAAADLLGIIATYIMNSGWENLKNQQEMAHQQALLNEEVQRRKFLEEQVNTQILNYSIEKERNLAAQIRLGDVQNAKKIFQALLVDIFMDSAAKLNILKARILELEVILSRASVEGGADLITALEISSEFLISISSLENIDEISLLAEKSLDKFIHAVQDSRATKNRIVVQDIKKYIRNNFDKSPTLNDIACSVYLSPSYASRIFSENQGITISDYIAKVKLEEAKKMLHNNPDYTVEYISQILGYNDSSYFSKVFRKREGMSPTQYKHSYMG